MSGNASPNFLVSNVIVLNSHSVLCIDQGRRNTQSRYPRKPRLSHTTVPSLSGTSVQISVVNVICPGTCVTYVPLVGLGLINLYAFSLDHCEY